MGISTEVEAEIKALRLAEEVERLEKQMNEYAEKITRINADLVAMQRNLDFCSMRLMECAKDKRECIRLLTEHFNPPPVEGESHG